VSVLRPAGPPLFRNLRVFALDPSLSRSVDTAGIHSATIEIPWERDPQTGGEIDSDTGDSVLQPGPVNDYLEVIDYDPASDCFYDPVDLNHPFLLAQDGLAPSEGNPQFHQQMVYGVAMLTITQFERALGRRVLWSPRLVRNSQGRVTRDEFVKRLRIYPHALREANAYYSPEKKALLFGYFLASTRAAERHFPGGTVFTCLSHDIIAHETTHALLDGLHGRFLEPSNPDVLAFHEAFADIVAIFQHFTFPEVLRHQIARARGNLGAANVLLAQLAQEFGYATGRSGALRDALQEDPSGRLWEQLKRRSEPHHRGAVLVAAIFDAFLTIYRSRTADLMRIAAAGSGVLPSGELHADLIARLATEAAKSAQHLLTMCIRALDYCPPVDLTFGDYLRALITADYDLVRDDDRNYRLAVVEAFRKRGIYPADVRNLAPDSLLWHPTPDGSGGRHALPFAPGETLAELARGWHLVKTRHGIYQRTKKNSRELHDWLTRHSDQAQHLLLGIDGERKDCPLEVHSVRPSRRIGPDGQSLIDLIIFLTQRRPGYLDRAQQTAEDEAARREGFLSRGTRPAPDFWFRGGCTLVVDGDTGEIRYSVSKDIRNNNRLERQRCFLGGEGRLSLRNNYFSPFFEGAAGVEPFALLHQGELDEAENG
jgi:hypothetical protein